MKKRSRKFWAFAGILILIPVIALSMNRVVRQREAAKPLVAVAVVERGDLSANVYTSGTVRSKDRKTVLAEASGRVSAIYYEEGDRVLAGDVVVSLDTRELSYEAMEAEINLDLIRKCRTSELGAARRAYEEARQVYEDNRLLYGEGAVSRTEYEAAKRRYEDLAQEVDTLETVMEKEIALEAIRLEKLRRDLEKSDIAAPMDGTLTEVAVGADGLVALNQPVFTVEDLKALEVVSRISEYDIGRLEVGQEVLVTGQGSDIRHEGKVSRIAPDALVVNNGQGTETVVEVLVEIMGEARGFKPNFSAELQILTGTREGVLRIPYEAVYVKKNGEKVVFLVGEDEVLQEMPVRTGMEGDLYMEMEPLDGADPEGMEAVLNPTENLSEGMTVRVDRSSAIGTKEEGTSP